MVIYSSMVIFLQTATFDTNGYNRVVVNDRLEIGKHDDAALPTLPFLGFTDLPLVFLRLFPQPSLSFLVGNIFKGFDAINSSLTL